MKRLLLPIVALFSVLSWTVAVLASGGLDTFIRPLTAEESGLFHDPGINILVAGETAKLAMGGWIEVYIIGIGIIFFIIALSFGVFMFRNLFRNLQGR